MTSLKVFIALFLPLLTCGSWNHPLRNINEVRNLPVQWVIEKNSTISVAGKSNINQFNCSIIGYYQADTISFFTEAADKPVKLNGCLELDIARFDCDNKIITSDLRKTLKAGQYPQMIIRFLTLEKMPALQGRMQSMKGWVEIGLAGTRRTFQIEYDFIKNDDQSFLLNGKKTFCFSDFHLSAPKKLAGMIQIRDAFDVVFQLKLRQLKS